MKTRIITAVIALLLFVPIVLYGKWPLALLIYVMATVGLFELVNMKQSTYHMILKCISFIVLWFLLAQQITAMDEWVSITFEQTIIVFVMILLILTVTSKNRLSIEDVSFYLMATIYIAIGFAFFMQAREQGVSFVLFILFIIWGTDSGAYFAGRALGKHKLWPSISPNKTIEGAIGGTLIAVVIGVLFHIIHPFDYSLLVIVLISIGIAIVGQFGDLVASAFKRHFSVKDSGNIFPGHGGILDRFDSLLFVLPFLYVIQFI